MTDRSDGTNFQGFFCHTTRLCFEHLINLSARYIVRPLTHVRNSSSEFEIEVRNWSSKFERRSYSIIYKRVDNNDLGKVSVRNLHKRKLCTHKCSSVWMVMSVITLSNNTPNCNKLIRETFVNLCPCCKVRVLQEKFSFRGRCHWI